MPYTAKYKIEHCHLLNAEDSETVARCFLEHAQEVPFDRFELNSNGSSTNIIKLPLRKFFTATDEEKCSELFLFSQLENSTTEIQDKIDALLLKEQFSPFQICIENYQKMKTQAEKELEEVHRKGEQLVFARLSPESTEFRNSVDELRNKEIHLKKRISQLGDEISFAKKKFSISKDEWERLPRLRIIQICDSEVWLDLIPIR